MKKKAPVKKAPVKKAPVKKAPVKKAPVKKAPPMKVAPAETARRTHARSRGTRTETHRRATVAGASPAAVAERLGVVLPDELVRLWSQLPRGLGQRIYSPSATGRMSLDAALDALESGAELIRPGYVPLTYVDDRSLACVVCRPRGVDGAVPDEGKVVRWHLDRIPDAHQAAILDVNAQSYATSLVDELGSSWQTGYDGMAKAAATYQAEFVSKGVTPKAHNLRPFQLACQNVIIGLAAMRHDAVIDGLSVEYWQTCEVTHVATNEGNRALAALMLCDAFQAGGTMEINFSKHPEHRVPAALRRYGRTLGLELGAEIDGGASISPTEARDLFLAVTPMPTGLREVAATAIATGVVSPERLCYSLLSPIWRALELEFILRCSARASSILEGGAEVDDREQRLAELEITRAASMAGTLFRRLDSKDGAAGGPEGAARIFEDTSQGVSWRVIGETGAVEFSGVPTGPLPWQPAGQHQEARDGRFVVIPRPHPIADDLRAIQSIANDAPILLVIPRGIDVPSDVPRLVCPERLSEIDAGVARNLETSQLVRA